MFQYIFENRWMHYLLAAVLAVTMSLMVIQIQYVLLIVLGMFFLFRYRYNIIPIIITMLLVFVSDINMGLRIVINFAGISAIAFYFIKEYGLAYYKFPRFPSQIEIYLVLLICAMLISAILSQNLSAGIVEISRLISFIMVIYFLYALLKNVEDVYKYIYALIAAGVILSFSILINFVYSDIPAYLFQKGVIQEGGLLKNVSAAGGMLAVSLPLSFAAVFFYFEKRKKNIFILLFIIQIAALLLTNSRAAILSAVISIGYIHYFLARQYLKRTVVALVSLLLLLFIITPDVFHLVLLYFRVDRVFENTRYYLWDIAMNIFRDNPIFGVGPGMFKEHIYEYLPVRLNGWDEQQIEWVYSYAGIGHAHNFFLYYLAELGILGLLAALFLPVIFISLSYITLKVVGEDSRLKAVVIGITGVGIGLFVRSFFEATGLLTYGWITRDLPFWVCFIIILYIYKKYSNFNLNLRIGH